MDLFWRCCFIIQKNLEYRAVSGRTADPDGPSVSFDDLAGYGKTKTGSLFLERGKRGENLAGLLRCHSAAIVLDGNADSGFLFLSPENNFSVRVADGFLCVADQI